LSTSVFFSHQFGTRAMAFSIGKNSEKTGKLGNIHTTTFSLNCLCFIWWTSVDCSLTVRKKDEIFWFDSFVLLVIFFFLHYTYYYVTCNYEQVKRKHKVFITGRHVSVSDVHKILTNRTFFWRIFFFYDWLIIHCFTSRSRIFYLHGDVTIAGDFYSFVIISPWARAFPFIWTI
jgi:hypothetical protein